VVLTCRVSAAGHRENQASKIEDFFDQNDGLIQEMMHRDSLADNLFLNNLSQGETFLKNLSFAFTIIINLLIVWCGSLNPCPSCVYYLVIYDLSCSDSYYSFLFLLPVFCLFLWPWSAQVVHGAQARGGR
jgi:hypothetical protein